MTSVGPLDKLETGLRQYYASMHAQMTKAKDLYYRNFAPIVTLPSEDIPIHESSTAAQMVDALRDQLHVDQPKVDFLAWGNSAEARKHKALMEMWGKYVLQEIPLHVIVDPFFQAAQDLIWLGAACVKYIVDLEKIPDPPASSAGKKEFRAWEAEQAAAWPFVLLPIDPQAVFPAPGLEPAYFLEVQTRYVADVLSKYPAWTNPKERLSKGKQQVSVWREYWSKTEHIIEVDGERVEQQANPFGAPPYAWRYSGMGRMGDDGDPKYLATSILTSISGELEDEVRIKTAQSAQWQFHVFPRLLTTEDEKVVRKRFMTGPGAVIRHAPGQEPKWLDTPPPNPQMMQFLSLIHSNIYRRVGSALTERPEGVDAGIHQAILIGQAIKVLNPVRNNLNALATLVLNGLARQLYTLNLNMNVRGHVEKQEVERMVKASSLRHQAFRVTFEAVDPAENDRRMLAGLALLQGGKEGSSPIGTRTFREKYLKGVVEDPDEEEALVLAEGVIRRFVASGALDQLVLEELLGGEKGEQVEQGIAEAEGRLAEIAGERRRKVEAASAGVVEVEEETGQEGKTSALGGLL